MLTVPVRVASSNTCVEFVGRWAYGPSFNVAVSGTRAFAGIGAVLVEIDLSEPSAPVEMAELELDGVISGISFSGQHVVVALGDVGLAVIDASTPGVLVRVGIIDTPGWANDVAASGGYAFVADNSEGLRIIDVSTPASPFEVGNLDTPGDAKE